jgi:hypothetical protein
MPPLPSSPAVCRRNSGFALIIVLWTLVAAALSETANAETVPSASQPPPDVLTTRITVTAFGSRNTPVIRSAIVRFGAVLPRGYEVLAWQDGS